MHKLVARIGPVRLLVVAVLVPAVLYLLVKPRASSKPPEDFVPDRYMVPQPALTDFKMKKVREVHDELAPAELVLGVCIGQESRAYPINMMNCEPAAKVINDRLGGRPIIATWCDRAHNAIVYSAELDGKALTFGVFGQLWKDSMVMYDEETMSHWSHLPGEAKRGPLKGKKLTPIPAVLTDWETWSRLYPEGTVALLRKGPAEYTCKTYHDADSFLLGIVRDGQARTWSFAELRDNPVINDRWSGRALLAVLDRDSSTARLYDRQVSGRTLTFTLDGEALKDKETGSCWEMVTGRATQGPLAGQRLLPLAAIVSSKKVWRNFFSLEREE